MSLSPISLPRNTSKQRGGGRATVVNDQRVVRMVEREVNVSIGGARLERERDG
jgi:hypothetical protein